MEYQLPLKGRLVASPGVWGKSRLRWIGDYSDLALLSFVINWTRFVPSLAISKVTHAYRCMRPVCLD